LYIQQGYKTAHVPVHHLQDQQDPGIRLPKAVAFPDDIKKVKITPHGNGLLITPIGESWNEFFKGPRIGDDFMKDRDQPPPQERKF
jgi:antitoxin VapB